MKNKKNKRSWFIVLLVILLIVTGAFIGSFARYLTTSTVSDNAVTAKFGLGIQNNINLFSDSYTNVQADTEGKKIIAPGTEGMYQFEVTGTSEVAYKISANVNVIYSDEWNGYAPLKFSINGLDWTDLDEFKENLSTALESNVMPPNGNYTNAQTIYWKWPFSVSSENDIKDTAMGSAASEGSAPKVTVSIEATAAQID